MTFAQIPAGAAIVQSIVEAPFLYPTSNLTVKIQSLDRSSSWRMSFDFDGVAICRNQQHGVAFVRGTSTKVIEVASDEVFRGRAPHEIHAAHPYLSLPQIHAALGYYHEHQEDCDRQIAAARVKADELLDIVGDPALQEKLRRLKSGT